MKNEVLKKYTEELNNRALRLQKTTDRLNLAVQYNHWTDEEKKSIQWLKASVAKQTQEILDINNHIV